MDIKTDKSLLNNSPYKQRVIAIAKVCYQANKAWCEINNDYSLLTWEQAEQRTKDYFISGVEFRLNLESPFIGEDAQHNSWMKGMINDGLIYDKTKDLQKNTHPYLIPFEELPDYYQIKARLFVAIVNVYEDEIDNINIINK